MMFQLGRIKPNDVKSLYFVFISKINYVLAGIQNCHSQYHLDIILEGIAKEISNI